jgi:hypothetical protein
MGVTMRLQGANKEGLGASKFSKFAFVAMAHGLLAWSYNKNRLCFWVGYPRDVDLKSSFP